MEFEKLTQEKMEMQKHYFLVSNTTFVSTKCVYYIDERLLHIGEQKT